MKDAVKGTIVRCLREMVVETEGPEAWADICTQANFPSERALTPNADLDDDRVVALFIRTAEHFGVSMAQAADRFGAWWCTQYAPRVYERFFERYGTAKDFLLGMNDIHRDVATGVHRARPPFFEFDWDQQNRLVVHYHSHRGLIVILAGLIRGLGERFGEALEVSIDSDTVLTVDFPSMKISAA